ncbi:deoxyguanosinetriphosphate triphosphohydrolase [Egibacter rhizosphaerae]|uniref:Deoxyguanosinetriphosphate triphosphohydrolase n=1 Tax=Egibacter rhizosphaerae TaxID=1670831 RepID=A0A411YBS6_9ACTN|nr:deoxyguanosinetriphosphate triphosphohydrolase [Egibacter rhizosphaerae]QBI18607.1 deoxyguanosinetriphosphate triphosphohydrolase [Egibacter rhizosphaerae]
MIESFDIRERAEAVERTSLSTWAALSGESKGRDRYEDPDPIRTAFQQDRDRLLHADVFLRLAGTTQSFVPAEPTAQVLDVVPPWRSRLAHSLATSQLARTIARALRLNEDLAEAVALGQSVGAPPFGVAGEHALAEVATAGFDVGEQSLRVVERLVRDGRGLNLTWEVRDGLLHQTWPRSHAATHEGQVAALSTWVAGSLHDLTGALRGELVHLDDVPAEVRTGLGAGHGTRVAAVVTSAVQASAERPEIALTPPVEAALGTLEAFLDERVHGRPEARAEAGRAAHCLQSLAIEGATNPESLPGRDGDVTEQRVLDHLCRLTDREARSAFTERFLPRG